MKPDYRRLLAVLWNEEAPDRVPLYEHFVDLEVIEYLLNERLRGMALSKPDSRRRYLLALIRFYKGLGYDYVPLELPLKLPRTNLLTAPDTARLSRGFRAWQDEHHGVIETLDEYWGYPWPDPDEAADYELMEELCRLLPKGMAVIGGVAGGVLEHVMWLMGFTPFFRSLYKQPKLVKLMFERVGKLIYEVDSIIVEYDRLIALRMGDDMGFRKGTFVSPKVLRKYVFPWHKRCVDLAHKHGKPFILHSCGNLKAVMEDLIEYVRIDAKHSFEDAIMPVTKAKSLYGDRIAILGGVDVDKLSRLPPREFGDYVREVLRACAPGGGYALGSGNTITNYVNIENYLLMIRIGLKYGKYPVK